MNLTERFPFSEREEGEIFSLGGGKTCFSGKCCRSSGSRYRFLPFSAADAEVKAFFFQEAEIIKNAYATAIPVEAVAEILYITRRGAACAIDAINLSTEFSTLLKEAAGCDGYASDVLLEIRRAVRFLGEPGDGESDIFFAFRKHGVDHDTFLLHRIGNGLDSEIGAEYRSIWRMNLRKTGADMAVMLQEVWNRKACTGQERSGDDC